MNNDITTLEETGKALHNWKQDSKDFYDNAYLEGQYAMKAKFSTRYEGYENEGEEEEVTMKIFLSDLIKLIHPESRVGFSYLIRSKAGRSKIAEWMPVEDPEWGDRDGGG